MKNKFRGKIKNGKVVWDSPDMIRLFTESMEGQRVVINIEKERHKRSENQNNYYYGVVLDTLSDHTGYEKDELNTAFEMKFLSEDKNFGGEIMAIPRRSKTLNTKEFEDFIERIRRWASIELGINIPSPNEDYAI